MYTTQEDKKQILESVLNMVKNKDINIQTQQPQAQQQTQEKESITSFELTSIMLLGLWVSGNAPNMDWWWIPVPFIIPYIVMLVVYLYALIKNKIKSKKD